VSKDTDKGSIRAEKIEVENVRESASRLYIKVFGEGGLDAWS